MAVKAGTPKRMRGTHTQRAAAGGPSAPLNAIQDENGEYIRDEDGDYILSE